MTEIYKYAFGWYLQNALQSHFISITEYSMEVEIIVVKYVVSLQ